MQTELISIRGVDLNTVHDFREMQDNTLVFLHDSLGCIALWRDFPEKLSKAIGANLFIYDRRGYGRSSSFSGESRQKNYLETESDILMALLDKKGIKNPLLFGHSDGGTIALYAAAKYPEKIRGVFTEGAHVFVEELSLEGIMHAKAQYNNTNLKERLEKYHGDKTEALFYAWTETWLSPGFRNWNMVDWLPHIKCPVMVIQGTEDEFGSVAQVEAISSAVSGSTEIYMVINAGHSPHKQNETVLIDRCISFLVTNELV